MSDKEPVWLFPFHYMNIGDSFFIPTTKTAIMKHVVESSARKEGVPIKAFITLKENHLGVRVWRIG